MQTLAYVSTLARPFSDQDLDALLESSRRHNESAGITGLLIQCGECFLQVLEGEADAVSALYAKIKADSRHRDLSTVIDEQVAERSFPQWSMGYELVDSVALASTLLRPLLSAGHISHELVARAMLDRFEANWVDPELEPSASIS